MASQIASNPDHLLIPAANQATYSAKRIASLHNAKAKVSR